MLNFQYKGISAGKYVEGEIEALNNSEAAYKLKEQKVIITKLVQAKKKKEVKEKKNLEVLVLVKVLKLKIFLFSQNNSRPC